MAAQLIDKQIYRPHKGFRLLRLKPPFRYLAFLPSSRLALFHAPKLRLLGRLMQNTEFIAYSQYYTCAMLAVRPFIHSGLTRYSYTPQWPFRCILQRRQEI